MDHGARDKEKRKAGSMSGLGVLALICIALFWSPFAGAEPGRGRPDLSSEPKRSYAAIDVIMYQTSW
jgi:hypothetical protein